MSNEFQFGKDMKNNKDRGRAETCIITSLIEARFLLKISPVIYS